MRGPDFEEQNQSSFFLSTGQWVSSGNGRDENTQLSRHSPIFISLFFGGRHEVAKTSFCIKTSLSFSLSLSLSLSHANTWRRRGAKWGLFPPSRLIPRRRLLRLLLRPPPHPTPRNVEAHNATEMSEVWLLRSPDVWTILGCGTETMLSGWSLTDFPFIHLALVLEQQIAAEEKCLSFHRCFRSSCTRMLRIVNMRKWRPKRQTRKARLAAGGRGVGARGSSLPFFLFCTAGRYFLRPLQHFSARCLLNHRLLYSKPKSADKLCAHFFLSLQRSPLESSHQQFCYRWNCLEKKTTYSSKKKNWMFGN